LPGLDLDLPAAPAAPLTAEMLPPSVSVIRSAATSPVRRPRRLSVELWITPSRVATTSPATHRHVPGALGGAGRDGVAVEAAPSITSRPASTRTSAPSPPAPVRR
jgi:hypothetical protein